MAAVHPVDLDKVATNDNLAVGLKGQSANIAVRATARVKTHIDAAVGIEPGNVGACHAVHLIEATGDNNLAVILYGKGADFVVRAGTRIKACVQTAVGIEPRDVTARDAVYLSENSSDHDLAVGLNSNGVNALIRATAGIEAHIDAAIGIKPGDEISRHAIDLSKPAADDHLAVGLRRDREDPAIGAAPRIKGHVHAPIDIQSGDPAACDAIHLAVGAADQNFAVALRGNSENSAIGAAPGIKARIHAPGG